MRGEETLFGLSVDERANHFQEYAKTGLLPHKFYERMGGNWLRLGGLCLIGRASHTDWLDPAGCMEVLCASLVGVAPGRVLLWPESTRTCTLERPFLGFLTRGATSHSAFELHPLGIFSYVVTLDLRTTDRDGRWENRFRALGASAWMYYQLGSGHGESYGRLLFTPKRWAETVSWLDYWLPQEGVDTP